MSRFRVNAHQSRYLRTAVEEKLGNSLEAVQEYQRAAELNPSEILAQVQPLPEKAVHLDPRLGPWGILYSERKDFSKAISAYQQTIEVNPLLEKAHYRLAQANGQTDQISKSKATDAERGRHEIQQLVYTLRTAPLPCSRNRRFRTAGGSRSKEATPSADAKGPRKQPESDGSP